MPTVFEQLNVYINSRGFIPVLMIICATTALFLMLFRLFLLWRHTTANNERMRTLDAIIHITTPTNRRTLLCELRKRMVGAEGVFLEVAIATPLGLVRSDKLLRILNDYRKKLLSGYLILYIAAFGVPLLGLFDTLMRMYKTSILRNLSTIDSPKVISMTLMEASTPLLFGLLLASPSIILLVLSRGWAHASMQQLEHHFKKFCQIPTGQCPPDSFNKSHGILK